MTNPKAAILKLFTRESKEFVRVKVQGIDSNSQAQETQFTGVIRWIFLTIAILFAGLTIWTHLCQLTGISFSVFSIVTIVVLVCGLLSLPVLLHRSRRFAASSGRAVMVPLTLIALTGASLALFSNRPDADEVNYVPNVVHYIEYADELMGFEVHYFIGENDQPAVSIFQSTSLPFEFVQGALSWASGWSLLATRYFVIPTFAGLLLPLAWFFVLRKLGRSEQESVIGALFILATILLLGETHRSFGNYSFNRIFQGKAVFLSIVIPVFIGASLEFLRNSRLSSWLLLSTTAVCSVGLTVSSIPILAILSMLLFGAHTIATLPGRPTWRGGLLYFGSLFYPILCGVLFLQQSQEHLSSDSLLNSWWPVTFWGHAEMMFKAWPPASFIAVLISTGLAVLLMRGYVRKFLLGWIALAIILVLNPLVAPFLIKYVTSSNIYWRLFYTYPFPIVCGLAAIGVMNRLQEIRIARVAMAVVFVVLFGLHFVPNSTSVFRRGTEFGKPAYQLRKSGLRLANQVATVAPPGTMFAPVQVSVFLPVIKPGYKQLITRLDELRFWVTSLGASTDAAERRLEAESFIAGRTDAFDAFVEILDKYEIDTLVIAKKVLARDDVQSVLNEYGYREAADIQELVVLLKDGQKVGTEKKIKA